MHKRTNTNRKKAKSTTTKQHVIKHLRLERSDFDTRKQRKKSHKKRNAARRAADPAAPAKPLRGRTPVILSAHILTCLLAAIMLPGYDLATIFNAFFDGDICLSAFTRARIRLTQHDLITALKRVLRPLADHLRHPDCFFKKWRIAAIDGTQFSMRNTTAINKHKACKKAKSRKADSAFVKLATLLLVEIGTHAPLAFCWSYAGQSESALLAQMAAQIPDGLLLLADRLYGNFTILHWMQHILANDRGHYLIRVNKRSKSHILKVHADGSAQVELRHKKGTKKPTPLHLHGQIHHAPENLITREIQAHLRNPHTGRITHIRLWTSLSPAEASPAQLIALYAKRWDIELTVKELKQQIHNGPLLRGQTVESCCQEVVVLVLFAAKHAEQRLASASAMGGEISEAGALRISPRLSIATMQAIELMMMLGDGIITTKQMQRIRQRAQQMLGRQSLPSRRSRSCQRAVRQPVRKWPRMLTPTSFKNEYQIHLLAQS